MMMMGGSRVEKKKKEEYEYPRASFEDLGEMTSFNYNDRHVSYSYLEPKRGGIRLPQSRG